MASAGDNALNAALKNRSFDPVYYFYGDDDYLKDARARALVDAAVDGALRDFNLEQRRGAELDAESLDALLSTPPMLAERRVVVLRDVDKLKKDPRALLDKYLKRPATDTVLLLVSGSGVKADKAFTDRATAVEFKPLSGEKIPAWVTTRVTTVLHRTITADAVALLVGAVGEDLAQLAVELDKLVSYSDGEIDENAVAAVVGVRRGESLGDLLDAIAARDVTRALALVPGVLQQPKTTAVSIVMALTIQTLALSYGQESRERGMPSRALYQEFMTLLKETGAFPHRPWGEAVSAWAKYTDRWNSAAIDVALEALLQADEALKDTRLSSPEQLLCTVVLTLCTDPSSSRAA